MDRDMLIAQVKDEYGRLAFQENQDHVVQTAVSGTSPNAYYEELLGAVLEQITAGRFDDFRSGDEIVEAVAKNKRKWLPGWQPDGPTAQ